MIVESRVGQVTSIVAGELAHPSGVELGIAGKKGALLLDLKGNVKSAISFNSTTKIRGLFGHSMKPVLGEVDFVDVDSDGVSEFSNRGNVDGISLLGHDGNTLWYRNDWSFGKMVAADVDNDGISEFVVGNLGGDGIELLDQKGRRRWQERDADVFGIAIVRMGASVGIAHDRSGALIIRDTAGAVKQEIQLPFYLRDFSVCPWPNKTGSEHLITVVGGTIWIADFGGEHVIQLKAPGSNGAWKVKGTPVKLKNSDREYFAAVVQLSLPSKSLLYVYDPEGTLIYQETTSESYTSIAAVSLDESRVESIIVGGNGKVWRYDITSTVNKSNNSN